MAGGGGKSISSAAAAVAEEGFHVPPANPNRLRRFCGDSRLTVAVLLVVVLAVVSTEGMAGARFAIDAWCARCA